MTTLSIPSDYDERARALDISSSCIIQAPAGSGKTDLLTKRILKCLAVAGRPEEVLALTFTNKAVSEGRQRVMQALELGLSDNEPNNQNDRLTWVLAKAVLKRDEENGWDLLHNPWRIRFITLDTLNRVISAHLPILSGLGGASSISTTPKALYAEAVRNVFDELKNPYLEDEVKQALARLLEFADNRQSHLIPLLVKTLEVRDQWLGVINDSDTFEMESVIQTLIESRLEIAQKLIPEHFKASLLDVLHQVSAPELDWCRQINTWTEATLDGIEMWQNIASMLLTQTGTLRKKVTKRDGFIAKTLETIQMNELLTEFQSASQKADIETALSDILSLPDSTYPHDMEHFRGVIATVMYRSVAHLKLVFEKYGQVDFVEVALRAQSALGVDEDEVTDALLRQDVRIKHILLDEAQDTSVIQYQLLKRLTSGWEQGDGRTLFIVGDPQQSIYAFRQAEVSLFIDLWETCTFNHIPLERIQLHTNFRSDATIVNWFNAAFSQVFPQFSDPHTATVTFCPSQAFNAGADEAFVKVHPFSNHEAQEEADQVVNLVRHSLRTYPSESIAVLVRNRRHLKHILPALKAAQIDYMCHDIDSLGDTHAVREFIAIAKSLWHPMDRTSWTTLLRAPFVGLSWSDCHALLSSDLNVPVEALMRKSEILLGLSTEGQRRIQRLLAQIDAIDSDPHARFDLPLKTKMLWYQLGDAVCVDPHEMANIQTTLSLLQTCCKGGNLTKIEEFDERLTQLFAAPSSGQVNIMTIHKAKGLEFDTVILPGLGNGSRSGEPPLIRQRRLPMGFLIAPHPGRFVTDDSPDARLYGYMGRLDKYAEKNEQLRLLYVAITRAKQRLHLLGQGKLNAEGQLQPTNGSFLADLWPVVKADYQNYTASSSTRPPDLQEDNVVPIAPRINSTWECPTPPTRYKPTNNQRVLPSEQVINNKGTSVIALSRASVIDQIIGIVFHAVVETLGNRGIHLWDQDRTDVWSQRIYYRCLREGIPEAKVDHARGRIMKMVDDLVQSDRGQWLLANVNGAACEYHISSFVDNQWYSGVIDRVRPEGETHWLIDYKTGGAEIAPAMIEYWVRQEISLYTPQMEMYAMLYRRLNKKVEIRAALYFAALNRFIEMDLVDSECNAIEKAG